jgi:hypothetical protein
MLENPKKFIIKMFIDNFSRTSINNPAVQATVTASGALTGTITCRYKVLNGGVDIAFPELKGAATSTDYIYLSYLPQEIRPDTTQDTEIHIYDNGILKTGILTIDPNGLVTVANVTNTGGKDTFKNATVSGWSGIQSSRYLLYFKQ